MYTLFDHQETALASIMDYFDHGGKSCLFQAPTGSGKSLVASTFITRMRELSKPVYFVTHSKSLLWQFSDHLKELGLIHGIIAPGAPTIRYRIQVISAMSLIRKIGQIEEPAYLIFEESHHASAETFLKILRAWPNAKLLGLSATPYRLSGEPLDMFEHMVPSPPIRYFIDNCFLSDYDYFIPNDFNTEGIHHSNGDFNPSDLAERIKSDKSRIGNLVKHYKIHSEGLPGIAFGTSIEDSDNIAEQFKLAGYDMQALHSKIDGDVHELLKMAREGKLNLISTCMLINEGVDVKGLTVMLDGAPTESIVKQLQRWGRVGRVLYASGHDLSTLEGRRSAMAEGGKGKAQILDFSSNYLRHGLPDDEREWSLKGSTRQKSESKYKRCPECQRPISRVLVICPYCSHIFERMAEPISRIPEEIEGQLVPIGSMKNEEKNELVIQIARQATSLKEAIAIAKANLIDHRAAYYIWTKLLKKEA